MRSGMVRRCLYRLHEVAVARPTFRVLRELERSQWLSPLEVRRLQAAKLAKLLSHAYQFVPYYRRRFQEANVNPGQIPFEPGSVQAALERIPLLSKDEIRRNGEAMLWTNAPGGLFQHQTGGSTGEPLIFYFDRRRQAYDQAGRIRSHRWFEVELGDRELFLWGSPIEWTRADAVKRLRDRLINHRLLNAFDMSSERMDEFLDEWDRFRPTCIFGYPSSIGLLLDHAMGRSRRPWTRDLRVAFVTGETLFPYQRKMISSSLGVPVAQGYGSREAGFVAHECPSGSMHITAENHIVEVIDPAGHPLPAGQSGEIVVTQLDAYAMPFIRYRTGDVGRLLEGRCRCGRGLPLMDIVDGRMTDFLYLPDGTIKHALSIIYPIRETPGIRQFRVTQDEDFAVVLEVVADASRVHGGALERRIRPVVGEDIDLQVRFVDRIEAGRSGKFRHVVSRAGPSKARIGAGDRECCLGV